MEFREYNQIIDEVKSSNFIVIDKKVFDLYPEISKAIEDKVYFILSEPEESKTLDTYSKIIKKFIQNNITREDMICAVGGGATSDMAGFVAYTVLRGVKWKCITTTLLGMIDASIGGKVGINCTEGKNLIGGFHTPTEIITCMNFLETLTDTDYQSGCGELLKYHYLSDVIADLISAPLNKNIINECAKLKLNIVANDFKENGDRKLLNLGHTLGHALEKSSGLSHGICVALGLEMMINVYAPELVIDFNSRKSHFKIDADPIQFDFNEVWNFVESDKKINKSREIDIIVPICIGESKIVRVPLDEFKKKILNNEYCKNFFK